MKFIIFLIILMYMLTGCNNTTEKINYETSPSPTPNVTPQEPIKISGSFSTKITDKTPERLNNIQVGVKKLNGTTVNPGEEFSFNDQIGPRNDETGFEKAIIFDGHGNKMEGYGGGLCQISSTLYNAVLASGLEVTERHEHSRNVTYIEDGKDASVSYNAEDFKFKNTSSSTVKISATTDNDLLNISILSD